MNAYLIWVNNPPLYAINMKYPDTLMPPEGCPSYPLFSTAIYGHQAVHDYLYSQIKENNCRYIAIDGCPGVDWEQWTELLTRNVALPISYIETNRLAEEDSELLSLMERVSETQALLSGDNCPTISLLFNVDFLAETKNYIEQYLEPCLVIGPGAASILDSLCDLLIYIDIPRRELRKQAHVGKAINLFTPKALPEEEACTRSQKIDWPILEQQMCDIFPRMSLFIDDQRDNFPIAIDARYLRAALQELPSHPFHLRPIITMKEEHLFQTTELAPLESGVYLYDTNNVLLEFPFSTLVKIYPLKIMGTVHTKFYNIFPISCSLLNIEHDTLPSILEKTEKPEFSQSGEYYNFTSNIPMQSDQDESKTTKRLLLHLSRSPYQSKKLSYTKEMDSSPVLIKKDADYILEQILTAPSSCYNLYCYTLKRSISIQTYALAMLCMVIEGNAVHWHCNGYQELCRRGEMFLIPANAMSVDFQPQSENVKLICVHIKPLLNHKTPIIQVNPLQQHFEKNPVICLDIGKDVIKSGVIQNNPSQPANIHYTQHIERNTHIVQQLTRLIKSEAKGITSANHSISVGIALPETLRNIYEESLFDVLRTKLPQEKEWRIHVQDSAENAILGESLYGIGQGIPYILGLILDNEFYSTHVINNEVQYPPHSYHKEGKMNGWPVNGYTITNNRSIYWNKIAAEDVFSTQGLMKIADPAEVKKQNPEILAELAARGDKNSIETYQCYGRLLGNFLTDLVSEINPHLIILLGSIAKSQVHFLFEVQQGVITPVKTGILGEWAVFAGLARQFIP